MDGLGFTTGWRNSPTSARSELALSASCEATGLENFERVFDASIARNTAQVSAGFRLRYQAYCVDNTFEDRASHPDGMERDAHGHAVHALMTQRSTGTAIGTVRLLLPVTGGKRNLLPIQKIAPELSSDESAPFPIGRTAEISRFALDKSFHRHAPLQGVESQLATSEWRRLLLHLPVGLMKCCVAACVQEGMTHVAAVMEPALLRLLTRFGVHFQTFGGLVPHHGLRQPCWANLDVLLRRAYDERPDVWKVLTDNGRIWALGPGLAANGSAELPHGAQSILLTR